MRGILADANCAGQVYRLLRLLQDDARRELWEFTGATLLTFRDLELPADIDDWQLWETCQAEQVVLITDNRNADAPDSLETGIRELNQPDSLPVITIGDVQRLLRDRQYAEEVADRILEILFDIDSLRGAGRLYAP